MKHEPGILLRHDAAAAASSLSDLAADATFAAAWPTSEDEPFYGRLATHDR